MRQRPAWKPRLADSGAPVSERLVSALAADILDGQVRPGDRLPGHRQLAVELGIGLGTVTKAYSILERRGLVRGSHGRGTFVAYQGEVGPDQIDLSSNMPPPMLADSVISDAVTRVSKRMDMSILANYGPPGGHAEHRSAVAAWVRLTGLRLDPGELVLCNGAQQGIAAVLLLLGTPAARTPVLTEEFTYPGALSLARLAGHPVHGIPIDGQGLRPDHLDRALSQLAKTGSARPVIYVTPTLHNPTTATMRDARRREIVRVARRHDATIIEDDVYALSEDRPGPALVSLAPERTYYINSAAKALSPGIRIGLIRPPAAHRDATIAAVRALALPVSPLLCELLTELMSLGVAEAVRAAIRDEGNRRTALARTVLGSALWRTAPDGYHVFVPLHRPTAEGVVLAAAAAGVALTDPESFMADPTSERGGLRVCLGAPTFTDLHRGLHTVRKLLANLTR